MESDRTELRKTFERAAERYDRARPGYPSQLYDDIESVGRLTAGSRVVEVGCGTGQATLELARRGYAVTAVELGADLAAIARRKLAVYPVVEVVVADFDEWDAPGARFNAVVVATAFHWLDPRTRVQKASRALGADGVLAVVDSDHVAGGTEQFFVEVQDCYERFYPGTEPGIRLPDVDSVQAATSELTAGGFFGRVDVRRYVTDLAYSTSEYLDLLLTYSGHLALPPPARNALLECIGALIDARYSGRVTKRYLTTLRLAHRGR